MYENAHKSLEMFETESMESSETTITKTQHLTVTMNLVLQWKVLTKWNTVLQRNRFHKPYFNHIVIRGS